jgi:hypothetical protein
LLLVLELKLVLKLLLMEVAEAVFEQEAKGKVQIKFTTCSYCLLIALIDLLNK